MPNFLSVANRATVRDPYLDFNDEIDGAKSNTGKLFQGLRFAGDIVKGNPVGAVISDLIFPQGLADGTIEGAIKRNGGYIGTGIDP